MQASSFFALVAVAAGLLWVAARQARIARTSTATRPTPALPIVTTVKTRRAQGTMRSNPLTSSITCSRESGWAAADDGTLATTSP